MMKRNKLATGIWTYGMGTERYVSDGYKDFLDFNQRVKKIGELNDISGIEINYPNDIDESNYSTRIETIKQAGLEVVALNVELVCDAYWQTGSFSSPNKSVREHSISLTKSAIDMAAKINCSVINLWLGQDGFDYPLEADYQKAWRNLVDALKECAQHNPDIKLAIEYKLSEPKMKCYVNSAGKALALALATGEDNVGVTLDVGHAFNANESPSEAAAILMTEKRLFHIHINDNYGVTDDDMPAGMVHWPVFFEFFYWLDHLNYDGGISIDIYPYRDHASEANQLTIDFVRFAEDVAQKIELRQPGDSISMPMQKLVQIMREAIR